MVDVPSSWPCAEQRHLIPNSAPALIQLRRLFWTVRAHFIYEPRYRYRTGVAAPEESSHRAAGWNKR